MKSKIMVIYITVAMASVLTYSFAGNNESISHYCSESQTHKNSQACMDYITGRTYNKQNEIIDKIYNKIVLSISSDPDKQYRNRLLERLRSSELDWIKYKNKFCSTVGDKYYGGSIREEEQLECLINLTKIHEKDLVTYFHVNNQVNDLQKIHKESKNGNINDSLNLGIITKKADSGDCKAEYTLGRVYFSGLDGANKNVATACYWFRTASTKGGICGYAATAVLSDLGAICPNY